VHEDPRGRARFAIRYVPSTVFPIPGGPTTTPVSFAGTLQAARVCISVRWPHSRSSTFDLSWPPT
jgi:hypothetical protein